jgi:DNA-directed RNA polymerase subunit RPC12/RpoP
MRECPYCSSSKTKRILYGLKSIINKHSEINGGWKKYPGSPLYYCVECNKRFGGVSIDDYSLLKVKKMQE